MKASDYSAHSDGTNQPEHPATSSKQTDQPVQSQVSSNAFLDGLANGNFFADAVLDTIDDDGNPME